MISHSTVNAHQAHSFIQRMKSPTAGQLLVLGTTMTACADVIRSSKETWSCSLLQSTKSSSERGDTKESRERREKSWK